MKSTFPIRALSCFPVAPDGLAGWTVSPTPKGEPRFEISADGKSFVCTLPASGMVIIFR